jgi:phage head maturation protease
MVDIEKLKKKKLGMHYPVKSSGLANQVKEVDLQKRTVQFIANTYYWLDSDLDILIDGCARKTLNDRGAQSNASAKVKHLADHKMTTDKMVGKPVVTEETKIDGKSVIYYESEIFETPAGDEHLVKYQSGGYDNHSIGFRYKDLEFAQKDSDNSDSQAYWDEYYPQILNPEEADKHGFFFIVKEIELFEASVVTFGANSLTGVVGFKSKSKDDQLFELFSRMNSLQNEIKSGGNVKEEGRMVELQINQIKQIFSDVLSKEPTKKDTLYKGPSKKVTTIDYGSLISQL